MMQGRGVVRFTRCLVVQGGMRVRMRRTMADPLRQQRADEHAGHGNTQADQLWRNQAGLADQQLDQQPGTDAAENGGQRPCVVARFQKAPAKSGTKAPASVTL